MSRSVVLTCTIAALTATTPAFADEPGPAVTAADGDTGAGARMSGYAAGGGSRRLCAMSGRAAVCGGAAGAALTAFQQPDTRWGLVPELFGHGYRPLGRHRLYLRPGARLSLRGLAQSEMPVQIQVREHDLGLGAELGLLRDGRVIPSLTLGATLAVRMIDLDVGDQVTVMSERADRIEVLPGGFVQLGLGLPVARGAVVIEPVVRYEVVAGDPRLGWRWGVEISGRLGW